MFNPNPDPIINPYVLVTTDLALVVPSASAVDTGTKIEAMGADTVPIESAWRTIGAMSSIKLTGDKDKTLRVTTGNTLVLSEKLSVDGENVNMSEYQELRTALNNKKCKIILVDPDKTNTVPYAEGIMLSILPDISEDAKIKITGEESNSSLDNLFSIVALT